jgi:uncharacterized membrane protein
MLNKTYLKRLQKDLPVWVEQGWVTAAGQPAILQHVGSGASGTRRAPLAFATIGVLLLGTGVILFFAANWDAMSKLAKLALLFGGMWAVYLAAAYALARPDRAAGAFAQALLLLGTVLFGANINLVAQIYHISGHYPNAILLWAMGALAVAWLARSQPSAVFGLLVLTLWTGMEIFDFERRLHWQFLVAWALFLPAICLGTWRIAATTAMLALLAWGIMTNLMWIDLFSESRHGVRIAAAEISFLAASALLLVGVTMEWRDRLAPLAAIVQRVSLIGALLALYALTLREGFGTPRWGAVVAVGWELKAAVLIALAAVIALGVFVVRRGTGVLPPGVARSGLALLLGIAVLIPTSLFLTAGAAHPLTLYIGFNLLYYAILLWLIYVGYLRGDPFRVNLGFVLFALGMIVLYFDLFWSLMNRSFFFMGGGLLLCAGGYALEAQRRRLVRGLGRADGDGGAA